MDFDSLKTQVSNLTLYDLKAGVRKVQNAVMNLTEMESKVREATNGDPWGASATLMQEISAGTHNYQQLNEIMPMIYKRFTDKTAEEWRQIYKALQLLEFLVKNGSERVVDDARSHLSLLRMLRQFHYIDPNGKDQGINVKNRSIELVKLLGDVDQIRSERKKARSNKNKYAGVEGGGGLGGSGFPSGSRYGGFGSESTEYGTYQGRVFGDGGGFGGQETDYSGTQRRGDQFEEYDEDEEGTSKPTSRAPATRTAAAAAAKKAPTKAKQPEPDLFDFGDEPETMSTNGKAPATSSGGGFGALSSPPANTAGDDDDFDDFQSATSPSVAPPSSNPLAALSSPPTVSTTTSNTQFAAPRPLAAGQTASFNNLFATPSPALSATSSMAPQPGSGISSPPLQSQAKPLQAAAPYKSSGPNYYTSVPVSINNPSVTKGAFSPPISSTTSGAFTSSTSAASLGKPAAKPQAAAGGGGGDAFSSLWSTASNKPGAGSKTAGNKGPDLASLAKAKSEAGIWGAPAATGASLAPRPGAIAPSPNTAAQGKPATPMGNGLDDLLG